MHSASLFIEAVSSRPLFFLICARVQRLQPAKHRAQSFPVTTEELPGKHLVCRAHVQNLF